MKVSTGWPGRMLPQGLGLLEGSTQCVFVYVRSLASLGTAVFSGLEEDDVHGVGYPF